MPSFFNVNTSITCIVHIWGGKWSTVQGRGGRAAGVVDGTHETDRGFYSFLVGSGSGGWRVEGRRLRRWLIRSKAIEAWLDYIIREVDDRT